MRFSEILPILQASVSPVILISGVGLLILSMTNRLARVMDRARNLSDSRRQTPAFRHEHVESQLDILVNRGRLLRLAISFAAISALLAAVLVVNLFFTALLRWESVELSVFLFTSCLISLIACLLTFLRDINLSLAALDLELGSNSSPPPPAS